MDIRQVARLILTGEMVKVSESSRVEIIRLVLSARKRVVEYKPRETVCPVCNYFGLVGDVVVVGSPGNTRYCECRRCTATFTALACEEPQEKKEVEILFSEKKSKKKRKKKK